VLLLQGTHHRTHALMHSCTHTHTPPPPHHCMIVCASNIDSCMHDTLARIACYLIYFSSNSRSSCAVASSIHS
jgi:hypothetical protein